MFSLRFDASSIVFVVDRLGLYDHVFLGEQPMFEQNIALPRIELARHLLARVRRVFSARPEWRDRSHNVADRICRETLRHAIDQRWSRDSRSWDMPDEFVSVFNQASANLRCFACDYERSLARGIIDLVFHLRV